MRVKTGHFLTCNKFSNMFCKINKNHVNMSGAKDSAQAVLYHHVFLSFFPPDYISFLFLISSKCLFVHANVFIFTFECLLIPLGKGQLFGHD